MYVCYEDGVEYYSQQEIERVYQNEILKSEYPTFDGWMDDMLKMQILYVVNAEIKNVNGHYEIFVNGKFYCSCDNMDEVGEEIAQLKE